MTRGIAWLLGSIACLGAIAAFPAAQADGCGVSGEGSGSCAFSCPATDNSVGVQASITSPWLQWRSIEAEAWCGSGLAAACAGHGDCQSTGYGPYGSGACIVRTGQGVDFTGGCTASKMSTGIGDVGVPDLGELPDLEELPGLDDPPGGGCSMAMSTAPAPDLRVPPCLLLGAAAVPARDVVSVTITRELGVVRGESCVAGACVAVPVVCVGDEEVACAVGMDAARLQALHPDL